MDEWLGNHQAYPKTRSPRQISADIKVLVANAHALEKRIQSAGPKIVYIWVTHETAAGAVMNELTGKNTEQLGGPIGHLEPLKISLDGDDPVVTFRGETHTLTVDGAKMF